jgi:hypothetical protein
VAVWAITNTASLATPQPAVKLVHSLLTSQTYGPPPSASQPKAGPTPFRDACNADPKSCGATEGTVFPVEQLDSGDDRMEQVTFEGNVLWSALNTVVSVNGEQHSGIAYFAIAPFLLGDGSVGASIVRQGYLAVDGTDLFYPSIGTPNGSKGIMAFSLTGKDHYPSTGYTFMTLGLGAHDVHIAAQGQAPQDDFSGYRFSARSGKVRSVARWGDYSAATASGNTVFFSTEFIPASCKDLACTSRVNRSNYGTAVGQVNLDDLPF